MFHLNNILITLIFKNMKAKQLFKISALLFIPLFYFLVFSGFKETGSINLNLSNAGIVSPVPQSRNFQNYIWNNDYTTTPGNWVISNLGKYKQSLNFTGINIYEVINENNLGSDWYGTFDADLTPDQKTHIDQVSDGVMQTEGMDLLFERIKISRLCYGQRLVYEAEGNNNITFNDGFSYQTVRGEIIQDQGKTVVYASDINDATPRYICENIYENLQHGDMMHSNLQRTDAGTWFLKPMMKIPTGVPDNTDVVRVDVINYKNQTVKSVTIKARNFGIRGGYTEVYNFLQGEPTLDITGGDGTTHNPPQLNDGMKQQALNDPWWAWKDNAKTDFKIWWFGNCDVWFDKITVDDEVANRLFAPLLNFDPKIEDELSAADSYNWGFTYFTDEMFYSQIPCMQYVQNKMNDYNSLHGTSFKLHFAASNFLNTYSTKNNDLVFKPILDGLKPAAYNPDAHEFLDAWIPVNAYHPNNLDGRIPDLWKKSDADYNNFLQNRVFGDKNSISPESILNSGWLTGLVAPPPWGSFIYQVEKGAVQRNTYSPNTKFIMQPQIQFWGETTNNGSHFGWAAREPSSQEIEAQAMISLAHGADGLCWYLFQSVEYPVSSSLSRSYIPPYPAESPATETRIALGLLDEGTSTGQERHNNIYGQDKWNDVAAMNLKLLNWKPTLDAITWQSGWSVHSENANHEFITDIQSIDPEMTSQNPCTNDYQTSGLPYGPWLDCPDERYWEMGFFFPNNLPKEIVKPIKN